MTEIESQATTIVFIGGCKNTTCFGFYKNFIRNNLISFSRKQRSINVGNIAQQK